MSAAAWADRVWYGDDGRAAAARVGLLPLAMLFRGVVAARGALYDAGLARVHPAAVPALSVGNLTVGGTGKTPVAAWVAARLRARGARPALVLRGVGGDEPLVHALLNPDVPVVVDADRVRGAQRARAAGADVVVLDDAFQHRRAARAVDLVLMSAERADAPVRVLPAGPYREPLAALSRASAVVVTRKAATSTAADRLCARLTARFPSVPQVVMHLAPDALRRWGTPDAMRVGDGVRGRRVLAVSGIGDPGAFEAQLRTAGAEVVSAAFPDHHAFTAADAASLARRGDDAALVVCTLKDAVKLGPLWPRLASPLWYVSQRVVVERGGEVLDGLLDRLLSSRATAHAAAEAAVPYAPGGARPLASGTEPAGSRRPE